MKSFLINPRILFSLKTLFSLPHAASPQSPIRNPQLALPQSAFRYPNYLWLVFALLASSPAWAQPTLGLKEVLQMAEQASPDLKAAQQREQEARDTLSVSRSYFFPTLDLAAVDSTGFPGSSAGLDGFAGLVASPFRQGPAADVFTKWDLLDLSIFHDVQASKLRLNASQQRSSLERARVDQQALAVYLSAVRARGQSQAWQRIVDELAGIRQRVLQYVRNGQYSLVQRYLIENQLEDASLKQANLQGDYQTALNRLALLTGLRSQTLACPLPEELAPQDLEAIQAPSDIPLISQAQYEAQAARESALTLASRNYPRLQVGASAGYLSGTRLVGDQDYSAFVGVTLPLFEGFRYSAQEERAQAEAQARQQELAAAQLTVRDFNLRYEEDIRQANAELKTLQDEHGRVIQALALAKKRYLSFLGPLSDLQEALRNQVAVESQLADAKTRLFLAQGSKLLLGQAPSGASPK